MSSSDRIDALWEALAPHVEWPEGLSLVFLFAGHPGPVGEVRGRLERSVEQRGKTLKVLDPASVDEVAALVSSVIVSPGSDCGAVWISLLRQAGDPAWGSATREALQRLNERRFLLERDVRVPVVLVLPLELRTEVYVLAPDLWTVRSFAEQVPEPEVAVPHRGVVEGQLQPVMASSPPGRAEAEWARLLANGERRTLAVADGVAAFESALARGDLSAARRIAMETLAVVLSRAGLEVERADEFDVADALDAADLPDGLAKRDFTIASSMLGEVEAEAGNLAAARFLFQRALTIAEVLADADPHSAQVQRDISVSLNRIGNVEVQAGNLAAARSLFQRDLAIAEALARADPHSAEAQRDLSISLNMLGEVEAEAGNFAAALSLFQRSLDLREALAKADPHSAQTQRDLSVSFGKLGNVEVQAGNLAAARSLFQRSLELCETLAEADPHSAQASFDVARSYDLLAWLAGTQGDRATELDYLRRAHAALTTMDARGQIRGYAERERLIQEVTRRLC